MSRLIDYAGDVASGHQDEPTPPSEGSKDLQELREALVIMVDSLQERIAQEAKNAEAMQQFINDASHELRTPLTVVKGYNELLAGGHATPEVQARAVARMQREVQRMEELVRDLLLLAVLREAPHHAPEPVNLSRARRSARGGVLARSSRAQRRAQCGTGRDDQLATRVRRTVPQQRPYEYPSPHAARGTGGGDPGRRGRYRASDHRRRGSRPTGLRGATSALPALRPVPFSRNRAARASG